MTTMKEIRAAFKESIRFSEAVLPELADYKKDMLRTFEELRKEGYVKNFSVDFLRFANGYQANTQEYDNLHIHQTYDLWSISASKAVVKDMMIVFLGPALE